MLLLIYVVIPIIFATMSLLSKLPQYYLNNPAFLTIAKHVFASPCRFSGLFVARGNDLHLLLKDGNIYVKLDWEAFSLLRATSTLIVASGEILRKEPLVFKCREDYGDDHVKELYQAMRGNNRQKVFFFSKKMGTEELRGYLDEKHYDLAQLPGYGSVHEAIDILAADPTNLPLTVEFGLNLVDQYYEGVRKTGRNHIDTLLISRLTGELDPKFVGPKLTLPLEEFYQLSWKSEAFPCDISTGQKGFLTMEVYTPKQ